MTQANAIPTAGATMRVAARAHRPLADRDPRPAHGLDGIDIAVFKSLALGVSALYTGVAGALCC